MESRQVDRVSAEGSRSRHIDSSCDQRLSQAVTEAYVATQVGDMILSVSVAQLVKSERVVQDLLTLVSILIHIHEYVLLGLNPVNK